MRLSLRHTVLLLGITSVIISFLFFGRKQNTYLVLSLAGLLVAAVSFLVILFKDQIKNKLLWTAIVGASIVVQQMTEQQLIKKSYKILINKNEHLFSEVNNIILSKTGNVFYLRNPGKDTLLLSAQEAKAINELLDKTEVYMISKDSSRVYYGTYGMLDVHLGISYFYTGNIPDNHYRLIKGKWYY